MNDDQIDKAEDTFRQLQKLAQVHCQKDTASTMAAIIQAQATIQLEVTLKEILEFMRGRP